MLRKKSHVLYGPPYYLHCVIAFNSLPKMAARVTRFRLAWPMTMNHVRSSFMFSSVGQLSRV